MASFTYEDSTTIEVARLAYHFYWYLKPYDYECLADYINDFEQHYAIMKAAGCEVSDVARIWQCLKAFDDADKNWENRLHSRYCAKVRNMKGIAKGKGRGKGQGRKKEGDKIQMIGWKYYKEWKKFADDLVYWAGDLYFRQPWDVVGTRTPAPSQEDTDIAIAHMISVGRMRRNADGSLSVKEEPREPAPISSITRPVRSTETQTNETVNHTNQSTAEDKFNKPSPETTTPKDVPVVQTTVSDPVTKDDTVTATPATTTTVKDTALESTNSGAPAQVDNTPNRNDSAANDTKLKSPESKSKKISSKSRRRGRDDGYDDCDLDEPKFVDDVNYDDVDDGAVGDLDDKDVVVVNGEVRYQIPGYANRKKPRHALVSAPRFVIQNFFRQKFPGRPRCPDCRCQHPTERYMLCSDCDFCHVGGNDECYHQHPELRGTRPAMDKYRRPVSPSSTPSTGELVFDDQDKESDTDTVTGGDGTKGTVDDLTNSLGTLSFIEKDELQEDTVKLVPIFGSETNSIPSAFEPAINVELPIRTKVDDNKEAQTQEDKAEAEASTPTPTTTQDTQSSLNGADTAQTQTPLEGGGAPLSAENLSRVPHDQSHKRWASMSSLTTSSSGASLVAFQRRRKNQVQKKVAEIEKENAAAVKAAAERAALAAAARETVARATQKMAEQAAAEKALEERAAALREQAAAKRAAALREEAARKAELEDYAKVRAAWDAREAQRQIDIARDRAAKEARWAREDAEREERRIAVKKAKAARKRERQRERRLEREEQERQERQLERERRPY